MKLGLADRFDNTPRSTLEIEAEVIYERGMTHPLSGHIFFLLERNGADIISLVGTDEEKALNELRSRAVGFFVTDSKGKAKISDLEAGTYYVCGVSRAARKIGAWNVPVELKPGENNLVLDNRNFVSVARA
jgi:hypothetical protein